MFLLPNFSMMIPETGNAVKLPIGMANKTEPKAASLSCKNSFTSGILDAQEAKLIPQRKKSVFVAIRAFRPLSELMVMFSNGEWIIVKSFRCVSKN